jgi:hypothetical protein
MDTKRAIQNYLERQIDSTKQESMQLHETMVCRCFGEAINLFDEIHYLNTKIAVYEDVLSFIDTL